MDIIRQIECYKPYNDQENYDKAEMVKLMKQQNQIFYRENRQAHMTASAWVVNQDKSKVLMVYHNLYNSWSWMGGHADGETNLRLVAEREVKEESGLTEIALVIPELFSLEILAVDGHEKRGVYVPSHLHLNVTYLFEADERQPLSVKEDENSDVAWFGLVEAVAASTEPWFQERIYKKLNEKLRFLSIKTMG